MTHDITPGVKGLVFDLDGTLIDSMPFHLDCWKKACKTYGVTIDQDFLRLHTGCPGWVIGEKVIKDNHLEGIVTLDELVQLKISLFEKLQHKLKPIDSVVDIVKKYYKVLPMAVGTGGHRNVVDKSLEITGLTKYFDIVVTANDIQHFKPHPETFMKCAEFMGIEPKYIEVFEDGDLGIEAAHTAGMVATNVKNWYNSDWEKEI